MKNYFESSSGILQFENVLIIATNFVGLSGIKAFYGSIINNERDNCISITKTQLQEYKDWLALKQQALVNKANPMLSIGSVEQTSKPEITPELIDFLEKHLSIEPPCFLCKHEDEEEYCDECECKPDPEKFAKLNKEWQKS